MKQQQQSKYLFFKKIENFKDFKKEMILKIRHQQYLDGLSLKKCFEDEKKIVEFMRFQFDPFNFYEKKYRRKTFKNLIFSFIEEIIYITNYIIFVNTWFWDLLLRYKFFLIFIHYIVTNPQKILSYIRLFFTNLIPSISAKLLLCIYIFLLSFFFEYYTKIEQNKNEGFFFQEIQNKKNNCIPLSLFIHKNNYKKQHRELGNQNNFINQKLKQKKRILVILNQNLKKKTVFLKKFKNFEAFQNTKKKMIGCQNPRGDLLFFLKNNKTANNIYSHNNLIKKTPKKGSFLKNYAKTSFQKELRQKDIRFGLKNVNYISSRKNSNNKKYLILKKNNSKSFHMYFKHMKNFFKNKIIFSKKIKKFLKRNSRRYNRIQLKKRKLFKSKELQKKNFTVQKYSIKLHPLFLQTKQKTITNIGSLLNEKKYKYTRKEEPNLLYTLLQRNIEILNFFCDRFFFKKIIIDKLRNNFYKGPVFLFDKKRDIILKDKTSVYDFNLNVQNLYTPDFPRRKTRFLQIRRYNEDPHSFKMNKFPRQIDGLSYTKTFKKKKKVIFVPQRKKLSKLLNFYFKELKYSKSRQLFNFYESKKTKKFFKKKIKNLDNFIKKRILIKRKLKKKKIKKEYPQTIKKREIIKRKKKKLLQLKLKKFGKNKYLKKNKYAKKFAGDFKKNTKKNALKNKGAKKRQRQKRHKSYSKFKFVKGTYKSSKLNLKRIKKKKHVLFSNFKRIIEDITKTRNEKYKFVKNFIFKYKKKSTIAKKYHAKRKIFRKQFRIFKRKSRLKTKIKKLKLKNKISFENKKKYDSVLRFFPAEEIFFSDFIKKRESKYYKKKKKISKKRFLPYIGRNTLFSRKIYRVIQDFKNIPLNQNALYNHTNFKIYPGFGFHLQDQEIKKSYNFFNKKNTLNLGVKPLYYKGGFHIYEDKYIQKKSYFHFSSFLNTQKNLYIYISKIKDISFKTADYIFKVFNPLTWISTKKGRYRFYSHTSYIRDTYPINKKFIHGLKNIFKLIVQVRKSLYRKINMYEEFEIQYQFKNKNEFRVIIIFFIQFVFMLLKPLAFYYIIYYFFRYIILEKLSVFFRITYLKFKTFLYSMSGDMNPTKGLYGIVTKILTEVFKINKFYPFEICTQNNLSFIDVVGLSEYITSLDPLFRVIGRGDILYKERRFFLKRQILEKKQNKERGSHLLFTGVPGTGKTFLAKALGGELNLPVLIYSSQKFLSDDIKELKLLFHTAKEKAPCIVFIDEIDTLAQKRSDIQTASGEFAINDLWYSREKTFESLTEYEFLEEWEVYERKEKIKEEKEKKKAKKQPSKTRDSVNEIGLTRAQAMYADIINKLKADYKENNPMKNRSKLYRLLIECDKIASRNRLQQQSFQFFQKKKGIAVIGATNRLEIIDQALLRPGRFYTQIHFSLPTLEKRRELIQLYAIPVSFESNFDWEYVLGVTDSWSQADICHLLKLSRFKAYLYLNRTETENKPLHTTKTLEESINEVLGVEFREKKIYTDPLAPLTVEKEEKVKDCFIYMEVGRLFLGYIFDTFDNNEIFSQFLRKDQLENKIKLSKIVKAFHTFYNDKQHFEQHLLCLLSSKIGEYYYKLYILKEKKQLIHLQTLKSIEFSMIFLVVVQKFWFFYSDKLATTNGSYNLWNFKHQQSIRISSFLLLSKAYSILFKKSSYKKIEEYDWIVEREMEKSISVASMPSINEAFWTNMNYTRPAMIEGGSKYDPLWIQRNLMFIEPRNINCTSTSFIQFEDLDQYSEEKKIKAYIEQTLFKGVDLMKKNAHIIEFFASKLRTENYLRVMDIRYLMKEKQYIIQYNE